MLAAEKPLNDPSSQESANRRTLGIVFFTVFLDLVGFGIVIPIQPFYAETLGARPWQITLIGASYSLMQFMFAPFWGKLSDRIGRRPVMLTSIGITAIGYLFFGLSSTLFGLFAARMLSGLGGANIGTAQAIIADSTPPDKRAKGMGLIGAAFGLGFILGPAIGGLLVRFGLSAPVFLGAALSTINLALAYFYLPETWVSGTKTKSTHRGFSLAALQHAARHVGVTRLFILFLMYTSAFSMMEQVLGLFIQHEWVALVFGGKEAAARSAELTTYALLLVGVTATVIQGGLIGKLSARFGETRLLPTGMFVVGLCLCLIPFSRLLGGYAAILVLCVGIAAGSALTNPSLASLLSRAVDVDEQGGVLGLGQGLSALGRVFGPSVAGVLFELSPGVPFWTGGVIVLLCVMVALSLIPLLRAKPQAR